MAATRTAPEHLWFLDTWVSIRIAAKDGADGMSLLDHRAPSGDSPPLHVHHTEDEVFVVLEGELTFRVRDDELRLRPGETLLALKGIPHTYRVDSPSDGRWMTVTARGDFERLVRELGRPAERLELPPPSGPPSAEAVEALAAAARRHGIEIVGPPLPRRA